MRERPRTSAVVWAALFMVLHILVVYATLALCTYWGLSEPIRAVVLAVPLIFGSVLLYRPFLVLQAFLECWRDEAWVNRRIRPYWKDAVALAEAHGRKVTCALLQRKLRVSRAKAGWLLARLLQEGLADAPDPRPR